MRFAAWTDDGRPRIGLLEGDTLRALPPGTDLVDLLADAPTSLVDAAERARAGGATVPLAEAALTAPLRPPTVRDFVAFEQHMQGMALGRGASVNPGWYDKPAFYFSNPHGVIGPHDDVPVPPGCTVLDYELEVGAVIGRAGYNLSPEQARGHIAGYLIYNDWSARDLQREEMALGFGPVKGKDTATTLGPWLVTADELEPYRHDDRLHLRMSVAVNGVETGSDTLAAMAWRFEDLIAYASRGTWVRPGDVIGSGTCGNGCLMELWNRRGSREDPPPLRIGDVVTMSVEGIGTIRNRIVAGAAPVPVPRPAAVSDELGPPRIEDLGGGLYAYIQPDGSWMINNTGFLVGARGVVAVDSCSTERRTRAFVESVAGVSAGPIHTLVNTHSHPDHTAGNGWFPGATIVAHERTRAELVGPRRPAPEGVFEPHERGELPAAPPFLTFADSLTLWVDELRCEIRHVGAAAHTTNDTILWVPERAVLYAGDLLFHGGTPFVMGGSVAGSISVLESVIAPLGARTIVPGHGPVCGPDVIGATLAYLRFVQAVAVRGTEAGLSPLDAARETDLGEYAQWGETERIVGNLHRAYAEVDGAEPGAPIDAARAFRDMVAYNGGKPLTCRA